MVKLITQQKFKWGQKNIVPFAGEVQISETGEIEVESKEIADALVESDCGWMYPVGDTTTTTTAEPTTTTTTIPATTTTTTADVIKDQIEENDLGQGVGDVIQDQTNAPDPHAGKSDEWKVLNEQSKAELQTMVKKAEKPRAEWGTLNKEDLIDYILDNLK